MDDQEFMASVLAEMSDSELEAFCDVLKHDIGTEVKRKKSRKRGQKHGK